MPQFDPSVWPPQLVWLVITFVVLYFLMKKLALPRIGEVLEEREFRINESLRRAENLRRDAEDAVAEYEKMMADARANAQEKVREAKEAAAAEAAAQHAALGEKLAADIAAAEARIHQARAQAVASLREVAVSVAGAAAEKLLGVPTPSDEIAAVVDAAMAEQRR